MPGKKYSTRTLIVRPRTARKTLVIAGTARVQEVAGVGPRAIPSRAPGIAAGRGRQQRGNRRPRGSRSWAANRAASSRPGRATRGRPCRSGSRGRIRGGIGICEVGTLPIVITIIPVTHYEVGRPTGNWAKALLGRPSTAATHRMLLIKRVIVLPRSKSSENTQPRVGAHRHRGPMGRKPLLLSRRARMPAKPQERRSRRHI